MRPEGNIYIPSIWYYSWDITDTPSVWNGCVNTWKCVRTWRRIYQEKRWWLKKKEAAAAAFGRLVRKGGRKKRGIVTETGGPPGKYDGTRGKCNGTKYRWVFKNLSVLSGHRLLFILALICPLLEMTKKKWNIPLLRHVISSFQTLPAQKPLEFPLIITISMSKFENVLRPFFF